MLSLVPPWDPINKSASFLHNSVLSVPTLDPELPLTNTFNSLPVFLTATWVSVFWFKAALWFTKDIFSLSALVNLIVLSVFKVTSKGKDWPASTSTGWDKLADPPVDNKSPLGLIAGVSTIVFVVDLPKINLPNPPPSNPVWYQNVIVKSSSPKL